MLLTIVFSILTFALGFGLIIWFIQVSMKNEEVLEELSDDGVVKLFSLLIYPSLFVEVLIAMIFKDLIPMYSLISTYCAFVVGGIVSLVKLKYDLEHPDDLVDDHNVKQS